QPVVGQRVPAAVEDFLRRQLAQAADDRRAEPDARKARALMKLIEDERQPTILVATLVTPDGIAGPFEMPIGVQLAEDVVFVGAGQSGGQAGAAESIADRARTLILAQSNMTQVSYEAERRQRLAGRRRLERPAQRHRNGRRR